MRSEDTPSLRWGPFFSLVWVSNRLQNCNLVSSPSRIHSFIHLMSRSFLFPMLSAWLLGRREDGCVKHVMPSRKNKEEGWSGLLSHSSCTSKWKKRMIERSTWCPSFSYCVFKVSVSKCPPCSPFLRQDIVLKVFIWSKTRERRQLYYRQYCRWTVDFLLLFPFSFQTTFYFSLSCLRFQLHGFQVSFFPASFFLH